MFDLWYTQCYDALRDVSNVLASAIITTGVQACSQYNSLCGTDPFQVCSNIICNASNLPTLAQADVIDTAQITTVLQCTLSCDSQLFDLSVSFIDSLTTFKLFSTNELQIIQDLQMGLLTDYGRELLQRVYCNDAQVAYGLVVAGCALLLVGQFLDLLFLISLSRNDSI